MPNIKAAEKWVRQSEKRALRNRDVRTRLKTLNKKARAGGIALTEVESQFDKAAKKGVIHPNKAARKKSRLAKAIHSGTAVKVDKRKSGGRAKPAARAKKAAEPQPSAAAPAAKPARKPAKTK